MELKRRRKEIARFFAYAGLKATFGVARFVPIRGMYVFAGVLAFIGYLFLVKQRKIAYESLTIAFGKEKSRKEIALIVRQCFAHIAKSGAEMLVLWDRPQAIRARVSFQGEEHLKRALERGKGVILVSAHFGNFPLMMTKLIIEGYPVAGIMRVMRDRRVERFFAEKRRKIHLKTIHTQPRAACVSETIATLRNNELVFIPMDQNFGTGGVFVDFFGRKAATATGPVILAQRTKAALVPCFIVRKPDDTHSVIFEPHVELAMGETPHDSIVKNVQKLTDIIEAYIRKYPAEWGWTHRRWKSQAPVQENSGGSEMSL